jgi:hypothetical protein
MLKPSKADLEARCFINHHQSVAYVCTRRHLESKEVAARREVERQMASLRARFAEQARRLAQVDQEHPQPEQSKVLALP